MIAARQDHRKTAMKTPLILVALCTAALAPAVPAAAHHSFAMFADDHHVLIEGTVSEWHFNSPHTWLYVDTTDQNGDPIVWGFEGAAPVHAVRSGVTGKSFTFGEKVRVVTAPLKDGRPGGAACFVLKEDGSIANFNDGGCFGGPLLARWQENGWLDSAAHLDSHPAE
jgi:hypothetical protein